EEGKPPEGQVADRVDVCPVENNLVEDTRIGARVADLLGMKDAPVKTCMILTDGREAVRRMEMQAGHARQAQRQVRYLRIDSRPFGVCGETARANECLSLGEHRFDDVAERLCRRRP